MRYVFDTNILLMYLRNVESAAIKDITSKYNPLGEGNTPIICVVSVGELKALALKNNWGQKRIAEMESFLELFVVADINADDVLDMYAEIDAFSQNKLKNNPLTAYSARNMGKNDLWIAAVAAVTNASLISADNDFTHLHEVYFQVIKVLL